jgi:cellulose synthase/poly-beta-1,6-N-acetylglucosamine synthase-like glycosyltransferase
MILAVFYLLLMALYYWGWRKLPEQHISPFWKPTARISVLLPARNEAAHIGDCLRSIANGDYPKNLYEIIVLDDHSTDETAQVATQVAAEFPQLAIQVVDLAQTTGFEQFSGKKRAIHVGVQAAEAGIIACTDADCTVPRQWLSRLSYELEDSSGERPRLNIVTGPVQITGEHSALHYFQSLDMLGLMGITAAGIRLGFQHMGNGANLAYRKSVFEAVGGYAGNESVASGDDMFLLQKIAQRYPRSVGFVKHPSVVVSTRPAADWGAFVQQRLRWGSKNKALPEWPIRLALLSVFLFCWLLLWKTTLLLWALYQPTPMAKWVWMECYLLWMLKFMADSIFLREMCLYFRRKDLIPRTVASFFLHTLYIAFIGLGSLFFGSYKWKGRVHPILPSERPE